MSDQALSTRRDPRHALRPGIATMDVPAENSDGLPSVATVTMISLAGLGFRVGGNRTDLTAGALVHGARVRVGECEIEGHLAIRAVHPAGEGEVEIGALFYPADVETEGRLMALIAGIEAAREF